MGKVICPRHGPIIGRLACKHISAATWRGDPAPHSVRIVPEFGEGPGKLFQGRVEMAICEECRTQFGLTDGAVIEVDEQFPQIPEVFPVCPKCMLGI